MCEVESAAYWAYATGVILAIGTLGGFLIHKEWLRAKKKPEQITNNTNTNSIDE